MNKDIKKKHLLEEDEIINYILNIENREYNNSTIIKKIENNDIKKSWRTAVMTWLISLAVEDNAFHVAMYAQQYLDRFVSISGNVSKFNYQLYGVAAYHIAFKYAEEDFCYNTRLGSRLDYLVYMTSNAYTSKRLLEAEIEILIALEYKMVTVTMDEVMNFILSDVELSRDASKLKTIILILCVISELSVIYKPSILAHSIIDVMCGLENSRNSNFDHNVKYFHDFSKYNECSKSLKKIFTEVCNFKMEREFYTLYEYYKDDLETIRKIYNL